MLVGLAGCLEADKTACEDRICPGGQVCDPIHDRCVLEGQLHACDGLDELAACAITDVTQGICRDGVCLLPACGDGLITGAEECDPGAELPDCTDLGFYDPGPVACTAACLLDPGACTGSCGDGVLDAAEEACDPGTADIPDDDLLDGADCLTFGFHAPGGLACSQACTYDVDACDQVCGDGVINGDEDCDGGELDSRDCTDFGFYDAAGLACTGACGFDDTGCQHRCGDDVVDAGDELCDGAPPAGSCLDFGYDFGRLDCAFCAPGLEACGTIGWRTMVSGTDEQLLGVWGSAVDDVWAVGESGTVLRFDGVGWQTSEPLGADALTAIWGAAANDVYTVSEAGEIFHYDGVAWSVAHDAGLPLWDVHGSGPTDVYVVGDDGTALHFDGATWGAVNVGRTEPLLSVWAATPDAVFISTDGGPLLRWDGTTWNEDFPSLPGTYVYELWGSGPDDVYGGTDSFHTWHWNGTSWTTLPLLTDNDAVAIWGVGPDDVYLVSDVIAHHGGGESMWAIAASGQNLAGVWVAPDGTAFAVGGGGTILSGVAERAPIDDVILGQVIAIDGPSSTALVSAGVIATYDGYRWAALSSPMNQVKSVAVDANGRVHAVGPNVTYFDGVAWRVMDHPLGTQGNTVWSPLPGLAFAGADRIAMFANGAWSLTDAPGAQYVDIHGSSFTDVYAIASGSLMVHFDGSAWSEMDPETTQALGGIWAAGPNDAFVVGSAGTIRRFDGTSWNPMVSGTTSYLLDVWGTSSSNVYAVGLGGLVRRFDGTSWESAGAPAGDDLYSVWASAPNDVWAVGWAGRVLHYDGSTWSVIAPFTSSWLRTVSGKAGLVVIGDNNGNVWRKVGAGSFTRWLPNISTSDVWVASNGEAFLAGAAQVARYDGAALTVTSLTGSGSLTEVWGSGPTDVFVAGTNGVLRYDGASWSSPTSLGDAWVRGLWGSGPGNAYAIADTGVWHWDGSSWTLVHTAAFSLESITGSGPNDVIVAGASSSVLRWNGATWSAESLGAARGGISSLWCRDAGDCFATDSDAQLFHHDGTSWAQMISDGSGVLRDLGGSAGELIYLSDGTIHRIIGHPD